MPPLVDRNVQGSGESCRNILLPKIDPPNLIKNNIA